MKISDEVMRVSRTITGDIDSLTKAIIILGVNTTKNIALMISESTGSSKQAGSTIQKQRPDDGTGNNFQSGKNENGRKQMISFSENSKASALTRELANLPMDLNVRERLILTLSYHEDMSQEEVAKILGVSKKSAAKLHQQALQKLNKKMKGQDRKFSLSNKSH